MSENKALVEALASCGTVRQSNFNENTLRADLGTCAVRMLGEVNTLAPTKSLGSLTVAALCAHSIFFRGNCMTYDQMMTFDAIIGAVVVTLAQKRVPPVANSVGLKIFTAIRNDTPF